MARPEKWKEEYLRITDVACKLGATDQDVADMLGVSLRTIYNWRHSKPEFAKVLANSKECADELVERSLYQRAMGYSHPATKLFQAGGAIMAQEYIEHFPPDPTSMIFWLKNRQPDKWRDKREPQDGDADSGDLLKYIADKLPD